MKKALPTVLTSGIILIAAGYAIGRYCTVVYISSIGLLVSRGALVSVVLILTLLPALLSLADRLIIRLPAAEASSRGTEDRTAPDAGTHQAQDPGERSEGTPAPDDFPAE